MESDDQAKILLAIGALPDLRVFRNTVGEGWVGKVTAHEKDFLVLQHPRHVTFGLYPGSPDIVGWRSLLITPDMIGERIAQFTGLEVKTRHGRTADVQTRFLAALADAGACCGVVRSPDEALTIVKG